MSDYIQNDIKGSGIDIVQLINGTNKVVPITTAEAVVWHEDEGNMTLREKIESLYPTSGEPTTSYTAGQGIIIDGDAISVVVDDKTIGFNDLHQLQVNNLSGQIKEAVETYLGDNPLIKTEIYKQLPATGSSGILYLIGSNNDSDDSFDEYIWIVDQSVTPNKSYWEKLGTLQFDLTKLDTVYSAIFKEEVNQIDVNTSSIEGIKGELGIAPESNNTTIYQRLSQLETNYSNIAGLSFGEIKYELTYDYDIDLLYSKKTN